MNLNDLPDMSEALKQVQMYEAKKKGDGNLANNAVPYDKVTKADIITGAVGRDEEGGKKKPKGHDCAKLVKYAPDGGVKEEFEVIPEQHTLLEDGTVTHYDITDGEWIYENVPVEELEIVISEKHEHFANYDKNAEVIDEDSRRMSNKQHTARVRSNIKSFGSNYTPPNNYDPDANRGKGEVLTRKQIEKKRRKALRQEENAEVLDENRAAMGRINKEYHRKKEAEAMAARAKAPKDKKPMPKRKNDNPMYDPKSAGSSRVKGFKFTGEEVEELEETKLGDTAYARARDAGAQRRRTKEYKQGLNRSTTRKEKGMYRLATAQRRTDADLERQKATYDTGAHKGDWDRAKRAKQYKKEAFAFSEVDFEELDLFGEEIDAMTDEQLIDMMEDIILETAEDDQDLIEICEHLEEAELLSEDYYDSAVKASKEASKKPEVKAANRRARVERLKKAAGAAAKKVGSAAKAGLKTAGKAAARGAGYAAGAAQRAASSAKSEFQKGRERGLKGSGSSKPKSSSSSSSSSDDDGTDGKLDSVLSSIRGSKGKSSGGGSSSASSGGGEKKKKPGLLKRLAGAVGRGLKKAAGKTARAVSSGSDKLAKRLGEEYEHIAHLYESGLFSMEEIENVIEERYKGKHGQSEREYQRDRSEGGKMISGDDTHSGAAYSSRATANSGPNPAGGKEKPKGQGRMTSGARTDLLYRKAMLKKKEADKKKGGN